MHTIKFEHTGLTVSRLCFGAMTFGGQTGETAARAMIERCLEAGINFFDTANVYNGGHSESLLGKILGHRRKDIVLASKVRGKMGDGPDDSGLSRTAIRKAIEGSLRRLGTDYLDLYYLHQPDYAVPIEETLGAMDELVREGKVRYPAVSNYAAWQVTEMLFLAAGSGYKRATVSQPMYNLLARGIEQEYLPMCKRFGVSTVVYNPLAGGLLTGKQKRSGPLGGTRFDRNEMYLRRYWHDSMFDAVEDIRAIARRAGRSMVSLSLNWLLHHTQADCVILGASGMEQLNENLAAAEEGPLADDIIGACDASWDRLRGVTPKYNR
ncbi:MAG: aldo/keto reductase [Bryobacterales bacterium]|nr:aldo/keto reductase [Bryobacterales bacterium]